jgi:hypothetical protein
MLHSWFRLHCGPLTKLRYKKGFMWTPEVDAAFRALQQVLTMVPVLRMLAFNKEFIIECDVSGTGIGAILQREGRDRVL